MLTEKNFETQSPFSLIYSLLLKDLSINVYLKAANAEAHALVTRLSLYTIRNKTRVDLTKRKLLYCSAIHLMLETACIIKLDIKPALVCVHSNMKACQMYALYIRSNSLERAKCGYML